MRAAKFLVALLTAILVAVQTTLPLSESAHAWVAAILSALGAVGVYVTPNRPDPAAG